MRVYMQTRLSHYSRHALIHSHTHALILMHASQSSLANSCSTQTKQTYCIADADKVLDVDHLGGVGGLCGLSKLLLGWAGHFVGVVEVLEYKKERVEK